ncbi:hypothetical protein CWD08_21430 [Salmonella enterica]|nr:hypothetical protein [Salmonella enterica]
MKKNVFILLFFIVFTAHADISTVLKKRSDATSSAVVAGVSEQQKIQSEKLKIQLRIDELRTRIGASNDYRERQNLQNELNTLEQKKRKFAR